MSEIKVDKITPSKNPVKVTVSSGISVKDETRLLDRQESFGVTENGEIKILAPLNIGSLTQTSSGQSNQVLLSRGPYLPPQWGAVPSVICPTIAPYGSMWNMGNNTAYYLGRGLGESQFFQFSTPNTSKTLLQVGTSNIWNYISKSAPAAIKTDGTLWTWGDYTLGQLGTGQKTDYSGATPPISGRAWDAPIQVGIEDKWIKVCGGSLNSCMWGLKSDGSVWVWGSNDNYNYAINSLGNFSAVSAEPVRLGTNLPTDFKFLSDIGSRLIKNNGTLWAWGTNSFYECGIANSAQPVKVVTQVGTATDWQFVALTKGIKTNGSLWSWGSVAGDGTTNTQQTPKQIDGGSWKMVTEDASGLSVAFAIKTDGTLWAWGRNGSGTQLGLGSNFSTNARVTTPTQVGTDNDWKDVIVLGTSITTGAILLKENGTIWAVGTATQAFGSNTSITYYVPTQLPQGRNVLWAKLGGIGRVGTFQGIGSEVLVAPQYTISQWLRTGYTSLASSCGNDTENINDVEPSAPTGWVYCDGRNGTVNMKTYINPITSKLDWPPIDNVDGCGNTPSNKNGLISGQLTYIQKLA
jgi:alpha-tubulin suppressor-like RCC1 family protein